MERWPYWRARPGLVLSSGPCVRRGRAVWRQRRSVACAEAGGCHGRGFHPPGCKVVAQLYEASLEQQSIICIRCFNNSFGPHCSPSSRRMNETIRVTDTAEISTRPDLLARFVADGKLPKTVLIVDVKEVFNEPGSLRRSRHAAISDQESV